MKKDQTRFTIRFNPADPRHQTAMSALELAGRRKATLIADAVCEYLLRHSDNECAYQLAPVFIENNSPESSIPSDDAVLRETVQDITIKSHTDTEYNVLVVPHKYV